MNRESIVDIYFSEIHDKKEKLVLKRRGNLHHVKVNFKIDGEINLRDSREAAEFLKEFSRKKLIVHYDKPGGGMIRGISPVSSFEIYSDSFEVTFSKEYMDIISNLPASMKERIRMSFLFNEKKSIFLYTKFRDLKSNKNIVMSLEELRKIFSAEDMYSRIYDFEKKILKPVMRDIEENTQLKVSYEKVKESSTNPNSRVVAVKFYITDILEGRIEDLLIKVEKSLRSKGIEIMPYRERIRESIEVQGEQYFKDNYNVAAKVNGSFMSNLFKSLEENWSKNPHKIHVESPVLEFQKQLAPTRSITSYIYEVSSALNRNFPDTGLKKLPLFFLKNAHRFKEEGKLEFTTDNYKLFMTINENYTTTIKLFKSR